MKILICATARDAAFIWLTNALMRKMLLMILVSAFRTITLIFMIVAMVLLVLPQVNAHRNMGLT